jgi:hypothetical protein
MYAPIPTSTLNHQKLLESIGAVETVLEIWTNCDNAYVSTIVTDEDSTTRSRLSHSMADLVNAGKNVRSRAPV